MVMYSSSFLSVLAILDEHVALSPDLSVQRPNRLLFHSRSNHCSLLANQPGVASRLSSLGLPPAVYQELSALLESDLPVDRGLVEQAQRLLLEALSTATTSLDPSAIPHLVQSAFSAFYNHSIHSRLDTLQNEISRFSLEVDSVSEPGDSSESDQAESASSGDSDDADVVADEDDNAPVRPGEDIPPLDTKYLPIFEALHERGKVLTKPEKTYLVDMTGMTYRQITIWFQNRRRGELKEDIHAHPSSSRAASIRSDQTSDVSEDELDVDRRVATTPSDTTFNIRSWCLASAVATKHDAHVPPSPTKFGFASVDVVPSYVSDDDSDLSDTDDEVEVPPGLRVPSLAMSIATLDSSSDRNPTTIASGSSSQVLLESFPKQPIANENVNMTGAFAFSRPLKSLPASRRGSPPAPLQSSQQQQTPAFSFNFTGATPTPTQKQFLPASNNTSVQPPQFVTSNERGLTLNMDTTPLTTMSTLESPPPPLISTSFVAAQTHVVALPSSPAMSAGSQRSTPSPSSSGNYVSSPRPAVKPLPRRTGCAPRPRPPPRASSVSAPIPASARSSIVLPPSSNPSLASTTLGALLRPNPQPPSIPLEMEERLSAMAGRMGVSSESNPTRRSVSADASVLARAGVAPGVSALPPRGSSFSFGPAVLPGTGTFSGSALAPIPEQRAPNPNRGSPPS